MKSTGSVVPFNWRLKDKSVVYFFILPVVLTLAALLVYPFGYGITVSFFKTNLTNRWNFVWFKNYFEALKDPDVLASFVTTVKFAVMVVIGHFVLGFAFALLLNQNLPGRTFFRALLLLPWLLPDVVIGNLWKWIFHPASGLANSFLLSLGILDEPMSWLGNPQTALYVVVFICIWKGYPLIMIQILAGLQTISEDLVEAAVIDGANKPRVFLHVILPGMRATLVVTLILDTVWWFKHVTMIWLLTQGGPGTVTNTISVDIYKRAFEYFNFGSSSAIAVIVFLICIVINLGYRRLLKDA